MSISIEDLDQVITNLKIIVSNKVKILNAVAKGDDTIDFSEYGYKVSDNDGSLFELYSGACYNADLWLIHSNVFDEEYIKFPNVYGLRYCKLMTYLGGKFVEFYNTKGSFLNPVKDSEDVATWKNEQRWQYVRFCLDELEYFREHKKLMR